MRTWNTTPPIKVVRLRRNVNRRSFAATSVTIHRLKSVPPGCDNNGPGLARTRVLFFGAPQCPISLRPGAGLVSPLTLSAAPLVHLSSDKLTMQLRQWPRGRINDGSAYRPLFLHSPRRASRTSPLSNPIRHGCDQVLTTGRYHAAGQNKAAKSGERLVSASRLWVQIYFQKL
jgi:hypothetical protein